MIAEALTGFELMGLPGSPEFAAGSERLSYLGNMALFRAGWGTYLLTSKVVGALGLKGVLTERLEGQLMGLGFEGGYRLSSEVDMYDRKAQLMQAGWASGLARGVMEARGWEKAAAVYIGTSTMSREAVLQVGVNLSDMGYEVGKLSHHSLACQSWTTVLVEALTDPELAGQPVVVVGMDTLTGSVANPYEAITFTTFGNGGGAVGLIPEEEMKYLRGRTRVEYDEKRVTTCSLVRGLPPRGEWVEMPEGYELVSEVTKEHFAATPEGVFLNVPSKEGEMMIWMNGRGTYKYFVIEGKAPEMVYKQIVWYGALGYEQLLGKLGVPFGHQPSLEVMRGVNKRLGRLLQRAGVDPESYLFPWVMDETGFNNVSAGTGLIAWEEMVHRGMMESGLAHVMLGLGGSIGGSAYSVYYMSADRVCR